MSKLHDIELSLIQHFFKLRQLGELLLQQQQHQQTSQQDCPCYQVLTTKDTVLTECGHMFHYHCIEQHLSLNPPYCPMCRSTIQRENFRRVRSGLPTCDDITTPAYDIAERLKDAAAELERCTNGGDLTTILHSSRYLHVGNSSTLPPVSPIESSGYGNFDDVATTSQQSSIPNTSASSRRLNYSNRKPVRRVASAFIPRATPAVSTTSPISNQSDQSSRTVFRGLFKSFQRS